MYFSLHTIATDIGIDGLPVVRYSLSRQDAHTHVPEAVFNLSLFHQIIIHSFTATLHPLCL